MQKGLRVLGWLGKTLCCVGLGGALGFASVGLAYFHSGPPAVGYVFFPEVCAAGLAAVVLCLLAKRSSGRERLFWQLWAGGCALWMVGTVLGMAAWPPAPHSKTNFISLAFTFLPEVAIMAALVMHPELVDGKLRDPVVRFEAALVALWWFYLYLLFVTPWHWIVPGYGHLWTSFVVLHYLQDFALVLWLAALASYSRGRWRRIYGHLACAVALLTVTVGPLYQALGQRRWVPAMIFDVLIAGAFLWLALTPLVAGRKKSAIQMQEQEPPAATVTAPGTGNLLVSITVLGVPILTLWSRFLSAAPAPVARFRLLVSFATLVAGTLLVYRWQDVADAHRENMVGELETSVRELRRLQSRFAEAEKLASLGQLAAGAAHEINNPVAAMLGFAELLHADATATPCVREMGRKIGDQARRIRTLVHNLLSLGEFTSLEMKTVDLAALVGSAVDLLRLDARHRHAKMQVAFERSPLECRGDPEKLLQVFYRLLFDLSGEQGKKGVEVRVRHDRDRSSAVVEFTELASPGSADSITPLCDAQQAQQGAGLSLGVCYTIVQEHQGTVAHENLSDGRRLFRVSLPAAGQEPSGLRATSASAKGS